MSRHTLDEAPYPPTCMKTWPKVLLVLALVSVLAWAAGPVVTRLLHVRLRACNLKSLSPDGSVWVYGLPFQGVEPHPLDRCLRLYMPEHACCQTNILCEGDLRIVWLNDPDRSFSVFKGEERMMIWRTVGDEPTCTFGAHRITYDPHELWARTGRATPEASPP